MDFHTKPSVSYTLFLYRLELKRPQMHYKRLNKTKLTLTDGLITKSFRNLKNCSADDLVAISREIVFKRKLRTQLYRIHNLEKLGIENVDPNALSTEL